MTMLRGKHRNLRKKNNDRDRNWCRVMKKKKQNDKNIVQADFQR